MNRLELSKKIKAEGKKRNIEITEVDIYDRGTHLDFCVTVKNDSATNWVYKHQIEELVNDMAPLERQHEIQDIRIDWGREFKIGDIVEIDDLWIRLDADEKEPKDLIKVGLACATWRQGWVKGTVIETPNENDRALAVKFERDVWYEDGKLGWIGHISNLEKLVREDKIKRIDKGQAIYVGTLSWSVRKV
jgi:hypothetical protein